MKFNELRLKIKETGVFSLTDIFKWFPNTDYQTIKNQLSSWVKKEYLLRLKRNIYYLKEIELKEEFFLANYLYWPSYVSLESALNYYGIIPDVPFAVTSVTAKKTQEVKNQFGLFLYRSLKPELFFGWQEINFDKRQSYKIAKPEKALFDFLYLNKDSFGKNFPKEERFVFPSDFNFSLFYRYGSLVKNKKFLGLILKLKNDD